MIAHHNNKANARVTTVPLTSRRCPAPQPTPSFRRRSAISSINRLHLQHVKSMYSLQAAAKNKALMGSSARISLPQHLPRPNFKEISSATIQALVDSKDIPPRLIREQLLAQWAPLVNGLHSPDFSRVRKNPLPERLSTPLLSFYTTTVCPTHVLALTSTITSESGASSTQVDLYPIHELVFAASCSSFPKLPPSSAATVEGSRGPLASFPVVKLSVPSAWTFPILQSFLYNKDPRTLQATLLPAEWKLTIASILKQAMMIQGVWKNAIALGVIDERMVLDNMDEEDAQSIYDVIEDSWAQVLLALHQTTSR